MDLHRLRRTAMGLLAASGLASFQGCSSEAPTPPMDSKEFEAARQNYQDIRRSEYRRGSLEGKAKPLPKPKPKAKDQ